MRHFLLVILMIYMVSSPLFPHGDPDDLSGVFVLQEEPTMRVSIERGWERGGRIPVVLSFGDLEVSLSVKTDVLAAAADVESAISEMLCGDINLPFIIYEQNPLRTRMKLSDKSQPVQLKLDRGKKQVEVYVGNSRLKLNRIRVTGKEIVPGELVELAFTGLDVYTYKRFLFKPFMETIYAVPLHQAPVTLEAELNKKNAWALKIDIEQEQGRLMNRGGIK